MLRDGERRTVPGETLVPGDVVLIEAGDRVAADLRLIEARGLADESLLTGESVDKGTVPVGAALPIDDRTCMAFSGTLVTQGTAWRSAVATGAATKIGRIGQLLAEVEALTTP